MKLGQLLERVKLGENEYKTKENTQAILDTFDEYDNRYNTSKLLKILAVKLNEAENKHNKKTINRLIKASTKVKTMEDKLSTGIRPSKSYARMKLDSLRESYDTIATDLQNKRVLRNIDNEVLANALAIIRFQMDGLREMAEVDENYTYEELPKTFKPIFERELRLVEDTIE